MTSNTSEVGRIADDVGAEVRHALARFRDMKTDAQKKDKLYAGVQGLMFKCPNEHHGTNQSFNKKHDWCHARTR